MRNFVTLRLKDSVALMQDEPRIDESSLTKSDVKALTPLQSMFVLQSLWFRGAKARKFVSITKYDEDFLLAGLFCIDMIEVITTFLC